MGVFSTFGLNMRNSQVGDLLVASTIVEGTVLDQSVCLLVHEDEDNAIGLLLNRPLQTVQLGGTAANPAPLDTKKSGSTNRLNQPSPTTKHHKLIQTPPQPMIMIVGPKDDPAAGGAGRRRTHGRCEGRGGRANGGLPHQG
jgi:putative transcriptional regulator